MRFSLASIAVVALASQSVVADGWFGKAAYDKWHQTELERWLSDHNVPYPAASDRKDLQNLVKTNWENNVVKPYSSWDTNQLQNYLGSQGYQAKKGAKESKDGLVASVQSYWKETADSANDAYSSVQNWIFDSWTESQLKAFLDYNNIPNPSPRTRDSLLHTARSNYQAAATKVGETFSYPGDWLYTSWSTSDLKAWLDERGIPVPQPNNRDKLIASIRRNSKIASDRAAAQYASASKSAASAQHSLSDALLDSWSDSKIKEWFDSNGIKVPQGSKRNELIALARKHSAQLTGNNAKSSAASAFGAATSSAGNIYAQQTAGLYNQFRGVYDAALNNFGLASAEAKISLSSASAVASSSLSSASSVASVSSSKYSVSISKSAASASQVAAKSASSAGKEASKSGHSLASVASEAAVNAQKSAEKLASAASGAASGAYSGARKEL